MICYVDFYHSIFKSSYFSLDFLVDVTIFYYNPKLTYSSGYNSYNIGSNSLINELNPKSRNSMRNFTASFVSRVIMFSRNSDS